MSHVLSAFVRWLWAVLCSGYTDPLRDHPLPERQLMNWIRNDSSERPILYLFDNSVEISDCYFVNVRSDG